MDNGKKIIMENKDQEKNSLYLKLIPYFDRYGILLLLLIMIVVMHFLQPDVFLSWRNVTNIFKQISWQSMLALGVFMVIVTAGIDLSVGSIMMLSLMILAIVAKAGAPWFIVVLTPLVAGFLCGLFFYGPPKPSPKMRLNHAPQHSSQKSFFLREHRFS